MPQWKDTAAKHNNKDKSVKVFTSPQSRQRSGFCLLLPGSVHVASRPLDVTRVH